MDEPTTEIESQGLPERIEQILGLMKDSMTNLFALYPGDDFCISYTVVRQPRAEHSKPTWPVVTVQVNKRERPSSPIPPLPAVHERPIEVNLVTQGLAGKNPVDAWMEKPAKHTCPRCLKELGWGPGCQVCMTYNAGLTHLRQRGK